MKSIRLLDRRAGFSLSAIGLLLGLTAPAVLPALASADMLTSRSITLSSSAADAASVSYNVSFTGVANISGSSTTDGGVVIFFCSNSPLTGAPCTPPTGLDTTGLGVTGVEYNGSPAANNGTVASLDNNVIKWTANDDYTGGTTFGMTLTGIHNPTDTGTFYARITTYEDDTKLATVDGTDATDLGTYDDDGGVALNVTDGVGVTAYVMESMTFCVSGAAPSENCGADESNCVTPPVDAGCVTSPSMTIGETSGSVKALQVDAVSQGSVYAQLSTNASGGAVVNLKSDAAGCGGLYRNGNVSNCNIAPKYDAGGISAGNALFGLKVGTDSAALTAAGGAGTGSGDLNATNGYGASDFYIDYDEDNNDSDGITSTYGSALFNSNSTVVNNMNIPITFGASISNTTPAGVYGATFNMIATGTF